jgi:hypothetical protein
VKIPRAAAAALSRHVLHSVRRLNPLRFGQEPGYVAALFGRLDAVVYDENGFFMELRSTLVNDCGPNSAESKWGADFAITVRIADQREVLEKGILGQAKRGSLPALVPADSERLRHQAVRMSAATTELIGLEMPVAVGIQPRVRILEVPTLYQGIPIQHSFRQYPTRISAHDHISPPLLIGEDMSLGRYFHAELIRCLHGNNRAGFVEAIQDSSQTRLGIYVSSS